MSRIRGRDVTLAVFALAILPGASEPAAGIEFRAAQHIVVSADEVIADDLYAVGETVTVDGTVQGDLVASGREVRLNGEVTGDLISCGQAVIVNGSVGDDIRMAGMALQLGPSATVGDDIVSAGFSLETGARSVTRGSLLFNGFQALLAGDIEEGLLGEMDALRIDGLIGGDSDVNVGGDPEMPAFVQYIPAPVSLPAVPGGLTIGDSARIEGRFEYTSQNEARGDGIGSGTLVQIAPDESGESARKPKWPGKLLKWAGLLVLGLFLAWRAPGWLSARSDDIEARPLPLAGLGLLGLAGLPVAVVVAVVVIVVVAMVLGLLKLGNLVGLVVVLGLVAVALLLLLFWLTSVYLAPLLVGLCTGRWVTGRFDAERARSLAVPLLAGLALLALLRFVPILGFLVAFAVVLLGWGAILMWLWRSVRSEGPAAA